MPHPLIDVDPVALVNVVLSADADLTAALGGSGRVGGENMPPYPRVVVTDPLGGDDADLTWRIGPVIQVETFGDLDRTVGKAELRRIHYTALVALRGLDTRAAVAGEPTVTAVTTAGSGGWSPLGTGQPRYVSTLQLWMHPAR